MALELRQQLKLSQQLVMTPQLQQAIRLLQLSRLELQEMVQQEMLENPFLEETYTDTLADAQPVEDRTGNENEAYDRDLARDASWEDYLGEFASTPKSSEKREFEAGDEISPLEARCAAKPTLEGHLLWQLRLSTLTDKQKEIGEIIIGNLSSNGFLQADNEELAGLCGCSPAEVEEVVKKIQLMDPVGVASRNLRECLVVQLKNLNYDRDPILMDLVENHLDDLEARRYKPLLKKFRIDLEDLQEYLAIIQSLDPMPGSSFGDGEPTYVSPDVFVYKMGDEFVIMLNDGDLPQLRLSDLAEMDISAASDQEKEYFNDKIRSASWLIRSLYQRQRTLYKVTESIVRHQKEFFEKGITHLQPLILKDIADDVEMHESTISRITTNKYVATPHGIFELKFFFNSGLEVDNGSSVGSESVKALIRKFISEEDPKNPLSDEKIGEMLKDELKVNIARRTVAKYRTAMDIPSSSRRRKHF
ncbi:MAG: RNA polymerase factor sigma-54 [Desulfovibrio sp.]|nr:RNA polymerase factor sigma-54 [Desulfovibrio sp.]